MSCGPIASGVFATPGALEAKVVAIAESPIDAQTLVSVGLPAVALFGCALGPDRAALLRRLFAFRRVVLATDNDDAGDRAADELRAQLTLGTRCDRLDLRPCKDPNELLLRDRDGLAARVRPFLEPEPLVPIAGVLADDELLEYARERGLF
jgi:DNA primase